jgi:thioredoxin 1
MPGEPRQQVLSPYTDGRPPAAPHPVLIDLAPGQNLVQLVDLAPGAVLLDFYADWCGPCRQQGKVIEELVPTARLQQAMVIKIDVDQHPQLAEQLGVVSLPTLMLIREGRVVERLAGFTDRTRVAQLLAQ